jgi:transposase InsO family protein
VPTKDATASSAAKAILQLFARYGLPKEIQTDKGMQYCADVIEQLLAFFEVNHRYTLPYRPQANGLVERPNKEILRHLRAIVMDKRVRKAWSLYLPLVQRIMVYQPHESLGTYPARLLYGDAITPNRGLLTK